MYAPSLQELKSFIIKRKFDIILLFVGCLIGVYFHWSVLQIFVFLALLSSLLLPIRSQYLARVALFLLIITAVLLVFEEKKLAEEAAIYTYYFLIGVVIRLFIEIRKEKEK